MPSKTTSPCTVVTKGEGRLDRKIGDYKIQRDRERRRNEERKLGNDQWCEING